MAELKNLHHPTVISLYKGRPIEIKKVVDKNGGWNQYKNLSEKSKKLEHERFLLEKKRGFGHAT